MRIPFLLLAAAALAVSPAWGAQENSSAATGVPDLAARLEKCVEPLDGVFDDIENENLPLTNESGEPLGHRPLENRRQALTELRQTLEKVRAEPASLKWAATLLIQSESLSDDLYGLSQIAYDNDREEMGRRLSEVVNSLDAERDSIESLTLSLADEKEDRIRRLEAENGALRRQLKRATERH
jgi:hypothetical protein